MFKSIISEGSIVGLDFAYSDNATKRISVYLKSMASFVGRPSILEVYSMINGLFTISDIKDYMMKLEYTRDSIDSFVNRLNEWNIVTENDDRSYLGNAVNNSLDEFGRYRVFFSETTPKYIDLAILLRKYGFKSFIFNGEHIINEEDVKASMLLDDSDCNHTLEEIFSSVNIEYAKVEEVDGEDDIVFVVADYKETIIDSEEAIVIREDLFPADIKLTEIAPFTMKYSKENIISEFASIYAMHSDIVLGILNGFCS